MKKVSLLIAMIAFVCGNLFAQSYDFDQYNVGDKVAQTIGQPWTTWSDQPGSAEDAVFSDEQAASGTNSVKFTYGVDQIFNFNDETTGSYTLDWNMYIPTGKDAYLNIQHNFTGGQDGEWAFGLYFNTADQGTILHVSDAEYPFTFPFDTWFPVHFDIDLDNDAISLTIDGVEVHAWAFSQQESSATPGMRVLDALDFYPPTSSSKSVFYIDDFTFVSSQEDEVLIFDPFEEYTVGNKIAVEAIAAGHDWWTTWSNAAGGSEDGVVAEYEGTQCGHLTYGNDQVLLLGNEENGNYDLEFDILVPQGKNGYFNILHHFDGSNSDNCVWAMQCYLHMTNDGQSSTNAPGHGTIHAGSNGTADVECVYDAWMHFRLNVDTDTDMARYYYTAPGEEEVLICEWQWSLDSFGEEADRVLGAMDFFPPQNAANSEYYLDNFSFKRIGGQTAPSMAVSSEAIYQELDEDEVGTQTFVITNDGNSIGDWEGYIEFGQGEGGSQQQEIFYDNENPYNLTGLATANYMEIANKFTVASYGGSVMGTKLKSVKYFVATDQNDNLGFTGDLTLRAYKANRSGMPGELLGEAVIPENQIVLNDWNEGTFAEEIWLTGYDVFISAGFQQVDGGGPVVFDDGDMVPGVRYLSVGAGSGTWYLVDDIWDSNYNFCLHGVCEGAPIPGGWVTMDKNSGSLLGGTEDVITFTFNTIGMSMGEEHNATLLINTNDAENPVFNIPVMLKVNIDAVTETAEQLASVYPNPATSMVTLEGENLNSVAIYNVAGQLIRVVKLDNMINNIEMNVESGVYFFSIYDNNGNNSVQRVVIVK
jgi:hypothetical protein